MLNEIEFERYCKVHKLNPRAVEYVKMVRQSEPSRMVGEHAVNNVVSLYPSQKTGKTISLESRSAEKALVMLNEYDDSVLEMYEQIQPIRISIINKNGRKQTLYYTADLLVLTNRGIVIYEAKHLDEIKEKLVTHSTSWKQLGDGEFSYLPAEQGFEEIGLTHKVFAYSNTLQKKIENISLLLLARQHDYSRHDIQDKIIRLFDDKYVWSLEEIKDRLQLSSYTDIIKLIDSGKLYFDIDNEFLAMGESCYVSSKPQLIELNRAERERRASKALIGASKLSCSKIPNTAAAYKALKRLEKLKNGNAPRRTLTRWKKLIREGEKSGLSPFESMLPRQYLCGSRSPKIPKIVSDFLIKFLHEEFISKQGLSYYRGHKLYCIDAAEHHPNYEPVSITTFKRYLKQIPEEVIARARFGRRGANAAQAPSDPSKRNIKALLPWQSVAIDHYLADLHVVVYKNGDTIIVKRPQITAMIDLKTRCVVAATVSLRDPSKALCAKIIRECVRQHGKLPREIISDRGSDFQSVYFSAVLAHYGISHSTRPAGHARFGGEIEGFFRDFKEQWLSQIEGNTVEYKNVRAIDEDKNPKIKAVYTPYELYLQLQNYLSWSSKRPLGASQYSRYEQFKSLSEKYPMVPVNVEFDDKFLLATAVDCKEYKVDFKRGIHIDEMHYYSSKIELVRGKKTKLEVRRDPENPYIVYALIHR